MMMIVSKRYLGLSILTLISMVGFDVQASCQSSYQQIIKNERGLLNGSAIITSGGGLVGAVTSAGGSVIAGSVVSAAAPVTTSGVEAVASHRRNHARKIVRLLNEADLGNGLLLVQMAETLSVRTKKEVSVDAVAAAIRQSNQSRLFCVSPETLYSFDELTKFLAAELGR